MTQRESSTGYHGEVGDEKTRDLWGIWGGKHEIGIELHIYHWQIYIHIPAII